VPAVDRSVPGFAVLIFCCPVKHCQHRGRHVCLWRLLGAALPVGEEHQDEPRGEGSRRDKGDNRPFLGYRW
jgi:hypothetical protein